MDCQGARAGGIQKKQKHDFDTVHQIKNESRCQVERIVKNMG